MEFLTLEAGSYMYDKIIIQCPLNGDPFHGSVEGRTNMCRLITDPVSGISYHVYLMEMPTVAVNGFIATDVINFDDEYRKQNYYNSPGAVRFFTRIPDDSGGGGNVNPAEILGRPMTVVYRSGENVRNFIVQHTAMYLEMLRPSLGGMDFHIDSLFDVFIINTRIGFFRPIRVTEDRSLFIVQHIEAILKILKVYGQCAESREQYADLSSGIKERKICSAAYFKRRNVAPELKCCYSSMNSCKHITAHSSNGITMLARPPPGGLCRYLLEKMFMDHDECSVNEVLEFDCRLKPLSHNDRPADLPEGPEIPVLFTLNVLYKRIVNIHRLCLPQYLINELWYAWALNIFGIDIDLIKPNGERGDD